MGKCKTQRTEDLHNAARRYTVAKQAEQAIELHNFDKLIEQGLVVVEPTGNPEIYDYDPEYRRPTANGMIKKGGGLKKGLTPQRGGGCFNHNVPRSIY